MKKRKKLSVRVNEGNAFHHLWNNNGTWWCNFTVHYEDHTSERVRCSLKTHDSSVAKKLRDFLLGGGDPSQLTEERERLCLENADTETGQKIRLGGRFYNFLPDSHPLFARGFVIGGRGFNRNRREPETGKRN